MQLAALKINANCKRFASFIKSVGKKKISTHILSNSTTVAKREDITPMNPIDNAVVSGSVSLSSLYESVPYTILSESVPCTILFTFTGSDVYDTYDKSLCSRSYSLLSPKEMMQKALPIYQSTVNDACILQKVWNVMKQIDEQMLFREYREILQNDRELNLLLIRNGVVIEEQFDLLFDAFSEIITANATNPHINTHVASVLKIIGIQQANDYKIIPSDYTAFGSCFYILFEKYLGEYFHEYPQSKVLLSQCWEFIFDSVTFAFDARH